MVKAITGLQSRHKNVLQVEGGVLGQLADLKGHQNTMKLGAQINMST
jgi:hypothetical protein